jgi:hypothetical protein
MGGGSISTGNLSLTSFQSQLLISVYSLAMDSAAGANVLSIKGLIYAHD